MRRREYDELMPLAQLGDDDVRRGSDHGAKAPPRTPPPSPSFWTPPLPPPPPPPPHARSLRLFPPPIQPSSQFLQPPPFPHSPDTDRRLDFPITPGVMSDSTYSSDDELEEDRLGPMPHHSWKKKCDNVPMFPPPFPPPPFARMGSAMSGSDASLPGPRRKEQRRQEALNTELINAVMGTADIETVTRLLNDGAESNALCSATRTPVMHLCALSRTRTPSEVAAIASLLLDRGADVTHRDHSDVTVLHLAAYSGAADLIEMILNRYRGKPKLLRKLLKVRTRLPREGFEREPFPMSWNDSWHHSHDTVITALPRLELGSTALHVACQRVHSRCIRLLTSAGADRSILDARGFTPIDVLHERPGRGEDDEDGDSQAEGGETSNPALLLEETPDWVEVETVVVDPDALRQKGVSRDEPASQPSQQNQQGTRLQGRRNSSDGPVRPRRRGSSTSSNPPLLRLAVPQPRPLVRTVSADTRLLEAIGWLKADGEGDFMTGSALHTAVTNGCQKVVETLLSVDPSSACSLNAQGETPVHAAISVQNMEALRLLMKVSDHKAANVADSNGYTPLMLAVNLSWNEGVSELLLGSADVTAKDRTGSTALHDAAMKADTRLLRELLSLEEVGQVLNAEREDGFTPLFLAVESNSADRVQLLVEAGADLTHKLPSGVNVMHFALQELNRSSNVNVINYLAGRLGGSELSEERDLLNALQNGDRNPGLAPLHLAAKIGDASVVGILLKNKCNPRVLTSRDHPQHGTTALHIAAQYGHVEVVQTLMEHDKALLYARDAHDWRPIHMAAHFAQRGVLRHMINAGADLATAVRDEQNRWCSAMSLLIDSVAQPVCFLEELLNEAIALNEYPVSDHRARIDVRYDILIPPADSRISHHHSYKFSKTKQDAHKLEEALLKNDDDDDQCRRQMRVIDAILGSGNYFGQQALLQHPLVESFLTLKWNKMAPFFYAIVAVHVLFVFALTSLVAQIYWWAGDQGAGVQVARFGVFITATIIALQELLHFIQLRLMYVKDLESWLKLIAISLSVVVAFVVFEGVEQHPAPAPAPAPTAAEGISASMSLELGLGLAGSPPPPSPPVTAPPPGPYAGSADSSVLEVRGVRRDLIWVRHVTTLAVLLAYTELLLLLCRFPRWGLRVLMFYKVAINVIKMVLTFSFLIVGFALSFFVQFRGFDPFPTLLESLGKTIIMGTSEFDYGDIFVEGNDTTVGRILFFTFLLLVPVVLMNLLVGLAVSDIATLETKGRTRGLVKQAEFLSTLERLVYSQSVRRCIPSRVRARLPIYIPVSRTVTIYPGQSLRIIFEVFPEHIRDEIVGIAIQNTSKQSSRLEELSSASPRNDNLLLSSTCETRKIWEEISLFRREMVSRRELHEVHEQHERHFRSLHREIEALGNRIDQILNSLPRR